jgi:hypothetical protein
LIRQGVCDDTQLDVVFIDGRNPVIFTQITRRPEYCDKCTAATQDVKDRRQWLLPQMRKQGQ